MGTVFSTIGYYAWIPVSYFVGSDDLSSSTSPCMNSEAAKKLEILLENSIKTLRETKSAIPQARCDQLIALLTQVQREDQETLPNIAYLMNGVGFMMSSSSFSQASNTGLTSEATTTTSAVHRGRSEKALELFSGCLKINRHLYGENDSETLASSISNVGLALNSLNRCREAVGYLREALDMRKRLFASSKENPDVVASTYALASALIAAKDTSGEAAALLREAIASYSNLPGASQATIAKWEADLRVAEKL